MRDDWVGLSLLGDMKMDGVQSLVALRSPREDPLSAIKSPPQQTSRPLSVGKKSAEFWLDVLTIIPLFYVDIVG